MTVSTSTQTNPIPATQSAYANTSQQGQAYSGPNMGFAASPYASPIYGGTPYSGCTYAPMYQNPMMPVYSYGAGMGYGGGFGSALGGFAAGSLLGASLGYGMGGFGMGYGGMGMGLGFGSGLWSPFPTFDNWDGGFNWPGIF